MRLRSRIVSLILLLVVIGAFLPPGLSTGVSPAQAAPLAAVTAYDLIIAMNTLRVSYGLPALLEDPIVNAVAQSTAETMAASQMSWHIGNVRGRLAAAGYGGGATVWATENFAVGSGGMGIDVIMAAWADPDHMRPAVESSYCHVGAGVATASNGRVYYVLQAAYISGQACGSYTVAPGRTAQPGSNSGTGAGAGVGLVVPVKIATPDAEGKVFHVVQMGQSLWSIAIAYKITIQDLEAWNNITRSTPLQTGQRLFIPGKDTVGYATPTPKGQVLTSTPDADGRIIHEVQPYQTLITIGAAYNVPVERLLAINGISPDWPLQIGQKLLISPGNVTPSPTLNALQRLTPEPDGLYYHTVQSGQTLSWIAGRYDISLPNLLAWNGLNDSSIIRPGQKLILRVTPPAIITPTPPLPTPTPWITPSLTPTLPPLPSATSDAPAPARQNTIPAVFWVLGAIAVVGFLTWWGITHRR